MDRDSEHSGYSSPLRDRRARETRRAILASAQRLILERGYSATTMRDIATDAGVAIQTIYSRIGTKRDILTAFVDQIEQDVEVEAMAVRFLATDNPAKHLRLRAEASRTIYGEGMDTIEMLIQAQGTGPEIAEFIEQGDGRHRQSVKEWMVDRWSDGDFPGDLSRKEAIDIISTLSGSEVYRLLVRRCQWTPDRYEEWLHQTLVDLILSEKHRP